MSLLKDDLLPSKAYNCLPYILENSHVPEDNHEDIIDLLSLFTEHKVPQNFSIKLVHKHFDTEADQIVVSRDIAVPTQGAISITGPMTPKKTPTLRGLSYFVSGDGTFQPFKYTVGSCPNLRQHDDFLKEFSRVIVERGLQKKTRLDDRRCEQSRKWSEFEVPKKRGTIMIPQDVGGLEGFDFGTHVPTEWNPVGDNKLCIWCYGHTNPPETNDWFLAGKKLVVGSPLQLIVSTAISKL
ncbi:uncharacterized protein N7496_012051 [Penicillium cataractarum]|uniref:Uncharacterized protein n=1 Tax=Penicillium cataractarum TaxID=2100454 RepID=A0A9W9RLA0_9EURO|nr:uncharacterized protein N7496_012051 [Penicillium cataractarum]KAJ5359638.1 hypothetical protein N7496_012051 [Penicillium cataractarum]